MDIFEPVLVSRPTNNITITTALSVISYKIDDLRGGSISSQIGDEKVFLGDKNAACDTELLARLKD